MNSPSTTFLIRPLPAVLTLVGISLAAAVARAETIPELPEIMYADPLLELSAAVTEFDPRYKDFWIGTLQAPEAELRERAAYTLAWAHGLGMRGTGDAADELVANLKDTNRLVRLSSARCLVAIDASQTADALIGWVSRDGLQAAQVVEPALARWNHQPRRETWRQWLEYRIHEPAWLLLAIRSLGEVQDAAAADSLKSLVLDPRQPPSIRLTSAEALARIQRQGLEGAAESLLPASGSAGIVDRLAAVKLLRFHDSDRARTALRQLARDPAHSVATLALQQLFALQPDLILPLTQEVIARGDANMRRITAEALKARPTDGNLAVLADLMDDANPSLRAFARESLFGLADDPARRPTIIAEGERLLQVDSWRGLEQSLRLLADLDHKPQSGRFLELLGHDRPEVFVTAAWGLCCLDVKETLEPVLQFATERRAEMDKALETGGYRWGFDHQLAQIFQQFGKSKYAPADPLLRKFIPKDFNFQSSRAAAIWALGYLYEDKHDPMLAKQLGERLADVDSQEPEDLLVRRFSAVALGRIGGEVALSPLRDFKEWEGTSSLTGLACCWGVQRLTGESYTVPPGGVKFRTNFFLEPLGESARSPD